MADLNILYRGYIEIAPDRSGKKKIAKQKYGKDVPDSELLTLEQAKEKGGYAGVLRENVMMVDVDDSTEAEIVFKAVQAYGYHPRVTKTARGMHFTFFTTDPLKNGAEIQSMLGVVCDYKYGAASSYEVLKFNGQEREVLLDPAMISQAPRWIFPMNPAANCRAKDGFLSPVGMGEGDGRNEYLFKLSASNCPRAKGSTNKTPFNAMVNISKKQFSELFHIINDFVFSEPLPESEIETLCRQERYEEKTAFAAETQKKTNSAKQIADEAVADLIAKGNVRQFGNALYRKGSSPYYRLLTQRYIDNELLVKRGVEPEKATAASRLINALLTDDYVPFDGGKVGFRNGFIDWTDGGSFHEYTPETIIFRWHDIEYNPDADAKDILDTLGDWCNYDLDKVQMLLEFLGACFYTGHAIKKWWAITGKADTGKSTFVQVIRELMGHDMVGTVPIQDLKDQNAIATLIGKPVNIVDDGSAAYVRDLSNLRRIIQGDEMQVKVLYEDKFSARIEARMLFIFNARPRFRDDNDATAKKMMPLGFNRVYADEEKDPDLLKRLTTDSAKSAWVALAVRAMQNVLANNLTFTRSAEAQAEIEAIMKDSDQFSAYVNDLQEDADFDWKDFLDNIETTAAYDQFKSWARDEGYAYDKMMVKRTFTRRMVQESGAHLRKSNGKAFYDFTA